MKKSLIPIIVLACLTVFSCATSIPVKAIKPPELDLRGIKTIAILPFAYPAQGQNPDLDPYQAALERLWYPESEDQDPIFREMAKRAEAVFTKALKESERFNVISPEELSAALDPDDPAAGIEADAVVVGSFSLASIVTDHPYPGVSGKTIHSYADAVFVSLSFDIYRTGTDRIAASREIWDSATIENLPDKEAVSEMTRKTSADFISAWSERIRRAFAPYVEREERKLADGGKDLDMKRAKLLVAEGSYREALDLYDAEYRETGGFAAGFNAAIMKEILGDIDGAIADMDALSKSFPKSRAAIEAFRMRASLPADGDRSE